MKLRLGLIKRFLAGGITLVVVSVIFYVTGGATADAAALSAETPSGPAGSPVSITGDGFVSGVQVSLCWNDAGCDDLGTATPQGLILGSFSTEATIPESVEPGTYEIYGCQLLALDGLTCSDADFEVIEADPVTTTTTARTTTSSQPTTTAPSQPATSTTAPTPSTTLTPDTTVAGSPPTTTSVLVEASPDEPTAPIRGTEVLSTSGSSSQPEPDSPPTSTTTTLPADSSSDVVTYTPPTLSSTDTTIPGGEETPTIVLEAAADTSESLLAWLDDPIFFWAAWLIAVAVGGSLATLASWLIYRRRREG